MDRKNPLLRVRLKRTAPSLRRYRKVSAPGKPRSAPAHKAKSERP